MKKICTADFAVTDKGMLPNELCWGGLRQACGPLWPENKLYDIRILERLASSGRMGVMSLQDQIKRSSWEEIVAAEIKERGDAGADHQR